MREQRGMHRKAISSPRLPVPRRLNYYPSAVATCPPACTRPGPLSSQCSYISPTKRSTYYQMVQLCMEVNLDAGHAVPLQSIRARSPEGSQPRTSG